MSIIVDDYRTSWARRYIREAQADLAAAEGNPLASASINFALLAMKKSQTAVYYSLGDPEHLAPLVNRTMENEKKVKDTTMRLLIQMESLIQRDSKLAERLDKKALIEEARSLLEIASEIVNLMVGGTKEQPA